MLKKVDDTEKGTNIVCTLGGNQKAWFLTEDGLYEVLMQSRKPIAKRIYREFEKQAKCNLDVEVNKYCKQKGRPLTKVPKIKVIANNETLKKKFDTFVSNYMSLYELRGWLL